MVSSKYNDLLDQMKDYFLLELYHDRVSLQKKPLKCHLICQLNYYGSGWQNFVGTSHLRFGLSEVNPDKPFYKTVWQSFVGASHFCLLKMNLTSFSGWRLKPLSMPMQPLVNVSSTHNIPSEPQYAARQGLHFYFRFPMAQTSSYITAPDQSKVVLQIRAMLRASSNILQ